MMMKPLAAAVAACLILASTANVSAATFNPSSISDLSLWLDANQGVATSGSAVTQWDDQSGLGHHVTPNDGNPTLVAGAINGLNAVSFANNQQLNTNSLQLNDTTTLFVVLSPDSLPANQSQRFFGHYGNGQYRFNSTMASMYAGPSGGNTDLETTHAAAEQFQLLTYRNNDNVEIAHNNANIGFAGSPLAHSASLLSVGGVGGGGLNGSFQGDIAEVIAYNRNLTNTEIQQVGAYLAGKYAIAGAQFNAARDGLVVAENFDYNRPTSDVGSAVATGNYTAGANGSNGQWTSGWSSSSTTQGRINGADRAFHLSGTTVNAADVWGTTYLERDFLSTGVGSEQTMWVRVNMLDQQNAAGQTQARLHFHDDTNTLGFGFHDGQVQLQLGGASKLFGSGIDDVQWHTLVARIDFDAAGSEAITLWLDPTNLSQDASTPVGATFMDFLSQEAGVVDLGNSLRLYHFGSTPTVSYDNLRIGTTAASVMSEFTAVPEPKAIVMGLLAFALVTAWRWRVRTAPGKE